MKRVWFPCASSSCFSLGCPEDPFISVKLQVCHGGRCRCQGPQLASSHEHRVQVAAPGSVPSPLGADNWLQLPAPSLTLDAYIMETASRNPLPELPGSQGDTDQLSRQHTGNRAETLPRDPPARRARAPEL